MIIYYREQFLKTSLVPGYPPETTSKALAMWVGLLSGADSSAEKTAKEVDEKIFICRPYVFASAKVRVHARNQPFSFSSQYNLCPAPLVKVLPMCTPGCSEHAHDPRMRTKGVPYERFGYTWHRVPPPLIPAMYLGFLRLLDRQPGRMGVQHGSSSFVGPENQPGLFSVARILPSIYHDREWQRNTVCQDPHTSPGLPPLTFRGEIEGFWRSKFLFYDFDLYRQILAGNMRGVYTGMFAEHVTEMTLHEIVVKVRKEDVGGKGSYLAAGFDTETEEGDFEDEQRRIREGYGNEVCLDENAPDEPGWTKEILIWGQGQTSWGGAYIRGRVRSWDGMVTLCISYTVSLEGDPHM